MDQLMMWLQQISNIIVALGYPGVFVAMVLEGLGLPFPGDAFLAFYGYAISEGDMNGLAVLSIGTLGYLAGVSIIFWLTCQFGSVILKPFYRLHILNAGRMNHTIELMNKYGALLLIPGRFLPGIRSLSTYAAAFGKLPYSTFTFYTLVSAIFWCGMWIGLGFWFGENVQTLLQHVQSILLWLTVGVCAVAVLFWLYRRMQAKN
jgi:membrane protein DedA with SNARE-associated domain